MCIMLSLHVCTHFGVSILPCLLIYEQPVIRIVAESVQDVLSDNRRLQPGFLLSVLDEFLLSVPQAIESSLSDAELALFCIVYDSISFTATAIFRVAVRVINELIELFVGTDVNDEDFLIQGDDVEYFLSIPRRLALCGVG